MTYCTTLAEPLLKKIQDKKTLDEIGKSLCGDSVKNPRQKAIRLIRELLGEETLTQYAETLGYDVEKAELGKKPKKSLRKIETEEDSDSRTLTFEDVLKEIQRLISSSSLETVKKAITTAEIQKG